MKKSINIVLMALVLLGLLNTPPTAIAQTDQPAAELAKTPEPAKAVEPDGLIELNLPPSLELSALVEYISTRLGINIIYDDATIKRRVTISAPQRIPKDALLGLLQSILKIHKFMMVETDQEGFFQIVVDKELLSYTDAIELDDRKLKDAAPTDILTQIFHLKYITTNTANKTITPFLGKPGGNSLSIPAHDLLIITDRAANLKKITELLDLIDMPGVKVRVRFVPVKNVSAEELASQITELLSEKLALTSARDGDTRLPLKLIPDSRTNQIIILATEGSELEALKLITALDKPTHERTSPIRFYKLMNTTAADVLATIQALDISEGGLSQVALGGWPQPQTKKEGARYTGPNRPPAPVGKESPTPPAYKEKDGQSKTKSSEVRPGDQSLTAITPSATVTIDPNTNTVIVIASPAIQEIYEQLIAILDKRRPQVLIEITLVTLDTSDDFSLGVDLAYSNTVNDGRFMVFSSFGLSTVDLATGALTPKVGVGFNGSIVGPDMFNAVIRALSASSKAEVLAAPRMLVNDNASATLSSIAESPFTSINASQTVSTTSFAGYASAGTTLTVTPHIAEGDHLNLKYSITLNSFTGEGSAGIPPPRVTNELSSEITVPDGYGVIIGGLRRQDKSDSHSRIPFLGDIPVLKYLLGIEEINSSESTLFAFVRVQILRDDEFADLKFLSDRDLAMAQMPPNYPDSEIQIMQ